MPAAMFPAHAAGRWLLVATTLLVLGSAPVAAQSVSGGCIQVFVDNPHPGDPLTQGKYEVGGRATDSAAQSGSGIDRVQIFLDNRDLGGISLGEVSQLSGNRFHLIVNFPQNQFGLHSVFVYARSASSGKEGIATTGVNITSSH
jgi:hypothetical protein